MKFRQLLALCYHYLESDQDFKKCCDEVPIFKVECICVKWLCSKYLRQTRSMQLYYDLLSIVYIVYVTQASKFFFFFLEVRLGRGSSIKIKTADIQRIMCATVVTFKKKHRQRENQLREIMHVPVIEINLHNIARYQISSVCIFI